jgi:hypothetical protein
MKYDMMNEWIEYKVAQLVRDGKSEPQARSIALAMWRTVHGSK